MKKRYDLIVYLDVNGCAYPIVDKVFYSIHKLVKYCSEFDEAYYYDFDNDDNKPFGFIFDVFDNARGQYNVNDLVEYFKLGEKSNEKNVCCESF